MWPRAGVVRWLRHTLLFSGLALGTYALAQLPPRGITPTPTRPRQTPIPTAPVPRPTTPVVTPTQTPIPQRTRSTVASTRWRITAEVWDENNQMWAPEGIYEVTGGEGCYLFLEQPCAVRVEKAR